MKKELRSKSKRKWIVGGAAFFGAAALLTTGFATWIVGVSNTEVDGTISVAVDTATNKSVNLAVTLTDSAIKLAETEAHTASAGEIISTSADVDGDLEISGTITLSYGKDFEISSYSKLALSFPTDAGVEYINGAVAATAENTFYDAETRTGKAYISLPTEIDLTAEIEAATELNGTKTATKDFTLTISWGEFFGGASPLSYYNGLASTMTTQEKTVLAGQAEKELNAMKNVMTGNLLLKATLA